MHLPGWNLLFRSPGLPTSVSLVPGLRICATMPGSTFYLFISVIPALGKHIALYKEICGENTKIYFFLCALVKKTDVNQETH